MNQSCLCAGISKLTLGLVWTLICFFLAKELSAVLPGSKDGDKPAPKDVASTSAIKQVICEWTNSHLQHYKEVDEVKSIPDDFTDGKVFLALLDSVDPEK